MPATAGSAHTALADVAGLLGVLPPADTRPQVVLLDGTGARAGGDRLGVGINLAVGLVGRGGPLRRRHAETVWLGATVDEPWSAMARRLAPVDPPRLVVVDGEEAITESLTRPSTAPPWPVRGVRVVRSSLNTVPVGPQRFQHTDGSPSSPGSARIPMSSTSPRDWSSTAMMTAGWTGTAFIEDMGREVMDRTLTSPVNRGAVIGGSLAYQAAITVVQSLIVFTAGVITGARYDGGVAGVVVVLACAVLIALTLAALSDASPCWSASRRR